MRFTDERRADELQMLTIPNGITFWPVACFASIQTLVATSLGGAADAPWLTTAFTLAATVAFLVCGVNSDLFGRRWFIILGNLLATVGGIVAGSATSIAALITGIAIMGFGRGNCQLAAFAIPELLPKRYRPAAIPLAETTNYIDLICGLAAARYALANGEWRWLCYSMSIVTGISGVGEALLHFRPKHPRGVPWDRALRELDYVGAFSFTVAAILILAGVNYASDENSDNPKVIACLVVGCVTLVFFAC